MPSIVDQKGQTVAAARAAINAAGFTDCAGGLRAIHPLAGHDAEIVCRMRVDCDFWLSVGGGDQTATLAPSAFDGEIALNVGSHWVTGGTDANPVFDGTQHGGSGYYFFHGLSNPWSYYSFSGTWTAGVAYTVGFWTRCAAVPATFTVGYGTATYPSPFGADKATLSVSATETVWTNHQIVWTPAATYTSDGLYTSAGVKFGIEFASSSTVGVGFDDGTVSGGCVEVR